MMSAYAAVVAAMLLLLTVVKPRYCQGWSPMSLPLNLRPSTTGICNQQISSYLFATAKDDDDDEDEEEDSFNLEERLEKIENMGDSVLNSMSQLDPSTPASSSSDKKLGIDIGSQLTPLSEKEAAELRAAAMELINDGVAEGIDEIEKLRKDMKAQISKQKAQMELKSDLELQREQSKLLQKIDRMTGDFLTRTQATREETKLVAQADRSNEGGQGVEVGVWGMIGGAAVVTTGSKNVGLLGSVDAAKAKAEKQAKKIKDDEAFGDLKRSASATTDDEEDMETSTNRVIIVADTNGDPMAKQLVPAFSAQLEAAIPTLEDIAVYRPTDTIPLGGDNAICAILFLTSLTDRSAVNKIMERLLRRTMLPGGGLGSPPTQLIGISSVGTERTDKFPYSMQNLMGGGKLEQRRQIEEALIATVQDRVTSPPLDYTICKFGELKSSDKGEFTLMPGDVLDGTTTLETASNVLLQAVAYQPYARNSTLCAIGNLVVNNKDQEVMDELWDDAFLRLDGPEMKRYGIAEDSSEEEYDLGGVEVYDRLCEYLNEWAQNFALNPRGLTTPIRVEPSKIKRNRLDAGIRERSGIQLLFLPTATGKNYYSKDEERERESAGQSSRATLSRSKLAREGGIEVVVEITAKTDNLRIRAKRCNYADGVPLKELSEETILKRLETAIDVWCRETK